MKRLKYQQMSLPTVSVFLEIEDQILKNVGKRLSKHKGLLDNDIQAWQLDKLNQLGALSQENIITIAKHSGLAINEVSSMLEEVGYYSVNEIEVDLAEGVRWGLLSRPPDIEDSEALMNVLKGYERHSKDWINKINTTMLHQSQSQYLNAISNVTGKVLAGVSTPRQALREVAGRWANAGIPGLIDKAGRKWSTEAYVNMITRTVASNVAHEMQYARMDEYGADLIEISSHAGARPGCEPYQGRIYSRSGDNKNYPDFGNTSYGEAAGILGINCGHYVYPYIPGITKQTYHPYDPEESEKIYIESQKQRYLERQIRASKREYNMMEAIGDKEGAEIAKQKVLQRQVNMRGFIDDTGRTRRNEREQLAINNPHVRGRAKG